jgi:nucleoid-associated protein YgaU
MATKTNKKTKTAKRTAAVTRASESKVTVDRGESKSTPKKSENNFLDKIQNDLEKNQSYLNLILGALIVVVLGVLIFNYFNKSEDETGNVTPMAEQTMDENGDVKKENLPGKYTVKEGDTLFLIAQKYYGEGSKYSEIVKDNNLSNENIEVGQELNIPKVEGLEAMTEASATPAASPVATEEAAEKASPEPSKEPMAEASEAPKMEDAGTGGAMNQTTWGEAITGDSYTIQADDWLSKIAGRAYGDISKYDAIAKANNISNPDSIEVGVVIKIPRN